MNTTEFIDRLTHLDSADIAWLAGSLRHETGTADGEVSWWRATTAVTAILRRNHRSREAGLAAHRAGRERCRAALCARADDVEDVIGHREG